MSVVITDRQQLVKNCFAYGSDLGCMLVTNGEEKPYVLWADGTIIDAGLDAGSTPSVADNGTGNLTDDTYCVYAVVFVNENGYPLIGRIMGQPTNSTVFHIDTGGVDRENRITFNGYADTDVVTDIRIYRTELQVDSVSAQLAADSGLMYLLGSVTNTGSGSHTYDDNTLSAIGNDPIELDNFPAPQARYCVYDGEYFWSFGNHPLRFEASWTSAGVITITDTTLFYLDGRNDQYVTFEGITTGGIDGKGTHLFKYLTNATAQTVDEDGVNAAIGSSGSGTVVVSGAQAILSRSKYKNPFAWGYMRAYADEYIPEIWSLRVSGGLGTAMAVLPDQNILKLDMEFPAECVTFNLQTAATDVFEGTKQTISKSYSVTSHFSQFPAVNQQGRQVLWGMDFKNMCILESDGIVQVPISGPVSTILKNLSANRSIQLLSHGVYDPYTEINAVWVGTGNNPPFKIDLCIYQHVPSGFWGLIEDYDVLCSAVIEDEYTTRKRILVGTEGGFAGYAFDENTFGNWLPASGSYSGSVVSSTASVIVTDKSDISTTLNKDNYLIVVWPNNLTTVVKKINSCSASTITITPTFTINPPAGSKWYIGSIPVTVRKYFDGGVPNLDKSLKESWMTLENGSAPIIRYYLEHSETPTHAATLKQDANLDAWFLKNGFPSGRVKTFGIELLDHSYNRLRFYNMTVV